MLPRARARQSALLCRPRRPAPRDRRILQRPHSTSATPTPRPARRGPRWPCGWVGGQAPVASLAPTPLSLHLARIGSPTQNWRFGADLFFKHFSSDHIPAPRSRSPAPRTYTLHTHTQSIGINHPLIFLDAASLGKGHRNKQYSITFSDYFYAQACAHLFLPI